MNMMHIQIIWSHIAACAGEDKSVLNGLNSEISYNELYLRSVLLRLIILLYI